MFGKSAALLAALSLAASPTLAQVSARPLSIQPALQRSAAPTGDTNRLEGGSIFPPILAALIILGGILLATGVIGENHHPPVSP